MDQPPVDNLTDFEVHPQTLVDKDGEKLVAVVKATYHLRPGEPLEIPPRSRRRTVRPADVPWGKPEISSIMFPADVCLRKPGTDVVVVARAHAPNGVPVPSFDAGVRVGPLRKAARIFGNRVWQAGGNGLTPPSNIAEIEMRYDFAWGGADDSDPLKFVEEPWNPVGRGVVRDNANLTHKLVPNIEDPAMLISSVRTKPKPMGIGPIGRHWMPRRRYSGTYDQDWLENVAPLMPADQDDRFNNCASPGLHSETPLFGNEEVGLLNLVRGRPTCEFILPGPRVTITFEHKSKAPETFTPHVDTIVIDAFDEEPGDPLAVELVWRAYTRAPRKVKDTKVVVMEREKGK